MTRVSPTARRDNYQFFFFSRTRELATKWLDKHTRDRDVIKFDPHAWLRGDHVTVFWGVGFGITSVNIGVYPLLTHRTRHGITFQCVRSERSS